MIAIIQNDETTKKDVLSENNADIQLFFRRTVKRI